jgi:hypothetical protein
VVLLVDEIDRADEALEAVLLELLAEFQVSVPEVGTFRAVHQPLVVLTSNNTRDLSAALKRRCLHLFLDYPDPQRELEIIRSKQTGLPEALAAQLVQVVRGLRELDLRKAPSISEAIDWARTLAVLGAEELTAELLSDTANVVVKYEGDLRTAGAAMSRLVDPNAVLPTDLDRHQGHGHGHGHGHEPGHEHEPGPEHGPGPERGLGHGHGEAEGAGPDGRAVRAAKDRPGRHDRAYYGSPTEKAPSQNGTSHPEPPVVPAAGGSTQGSRSFGAATRRGRKRG